MPIPPSDSSIWDDSPDHDVDTQPLAERIDFAERRQLLREKWCEPTHKPDPYDDEEEDD